MATSLAPQMVQWEGMRTEARQDRGRGEGAGSTDGRPHAYHRG